MRRSCTCALLAFCQALRLVRASLPLSRLHRYVGIACELVRAASLLPFARVLCVPFCIGSSTSRMRGTQPGTAAAAAGR